MHSKNFNSILKKMKKPDSTGILGAQLNITISVLSMLFIVGYMIYYNFWQIGDFELLTKWKVVAYTLLPFQFVNVIVTVVYMQRYKLKYFAVIFSLSALFIGGLLILISSSQKIKASTVNNIANEQIRSMKIELERRNLEKQLFEEEY